MIDARHWDLNVGNGHAKRHQLRLAVLYVLREVKLGERVLDIYRYEVIDWDDPEVDPDPETLYESLFHGPWAEVNFKAQTAQYSVVGLGGAYS